MRVPSFLVFLIFLFFSCNNPKTESSVSYPGFSEKEIILTGINKEYKQTDTLGLIRLQIPVRLDTFYQWHRTSDCLPCGLIQYRFSDNRYKQFKEGGFYWTFVPDSVYQLTIRHNPIKQAPDSIVLKPLTLEDTNDLWMHQENSLSYEDSVHYLFKEYKMINNKPFVISAYNTSIGYLTQTHTTFIVAATTLKSRYLFFIGECSAKDTAGFISSMYKSFLSIRIKEKE